MPPDPPSRGDSDLLLSALLLSPRWAGVGGAKEFRVPVLPVPLPVLPPPPLFLFPQDRGRLIESRYLEA